MFKRLFFAMLGLGGGLALGVLAMRKVERTQKALAPGAIVDAVGGRIRAAVEAGRAAMAAKEAELRAEHGIGAPSSGLPRAYPGSLSQLPPD